MMLLDEIVDFLKLAEKEYGVREVRFRLLDPLSSFPLRELEVDCLKHEGGRVFKTRKVFNLPELQDMKNPPDLMDLLLIMRGAWNSENS